MRFSFLTDRAAQLRRSEFFTNVLKLAGGSAMGQILVVASTPFVTRIYPPSQMGLFGVFVAFLTFASVGATLRYDLAIVSSKDDREADVLLLAAAAVSFPYVAIAIAVFFLMVHFNILGYAAMPRWSALAMILALLCTGIFSAVRFWYVGRKRFNQISVAQVYQGAGRAALPLVFGSFSANWAGLVCGEIAGRMLGGTSLIQGAWPELHMTLRDLQNAECISVLRKYWKYPAVFLPSSVIDALATSLPLPVISSLFGLAAAGQYFLVYRLAFVPASLVIAGVADVFHARITQAAKTDRLSVRPIMKEAMRRLFTVGVAIYVPTAALSPFLFPIIFGASWKPAGRLMAIQALASITGIIAGPVSRALAISKHPEFKLIADLCRSVLPVSALFISHHYGVGLMGSIAVFCALSSLSEILYLSIIWHSTAETRQIVFTSA